MKISQAVDPRFIRFLLVGIINAAVGYGLFALLIYAGLHYSLSTLIATILGVVFNFYSTGILVFKNAGREFMVKFFLTYAVLYLINVFLLKLLVFADVSLYLGGFILLPVMAILSYILQSRFVFKPKPLANTTQTQCIDAP